MGVIHGISVLYLLRPFRAMVQRVADSHPARWTGLWYFAPLALEGLDVIGSCFVFQGLTWLMTVALALRSPSGQGYAVQSDVIVSLKR
jgi:hypothetical protein